VINFLRKIVLFEAVDNAALRMWRTFALYVPGQQSSFRRLEQRALESALGPPQSYRSGSSVLWICGAIWWRSLFYFYVMLWCI